MGPIEAIRTCLAKSFQFSGRATRPEYWWFTLASSVVTAFLVFVIDGQLLGYDVESRAVFLPFANTFGLLTMPAALSVATRRLHDRSLPGLPAVVILAVTYALGFVPSPGDFTTVLDWFMAAFVGLSLVIVVIAALPSAPGRNRYGANPHDPNPVEVFQ
ncbi:MAG: DUF805 domain-containing protein [Paracoccaceae bacterium]